jgi:UDP-N-acetylmuramate--alanine ligase
VLFGYQSPNIPRLAGTGRFARDRLQDSLLGFVLGAINGYLVWGTIWFYLNNAGYPFPQIFSPLPPGSDTQAASIDQLLENFAADMVRCSDHLFCSCTRICICTGGVYLMKHVHFIGIGGTGLSAIARLLLESGYTVSGSDRTLSPLAHAISAAGAKVMAGHTAENVQGADVVVRSSAIPDNNPEVQAALQAGIPVLKRSAFLGTFMAGFTTVAVAGTHGKTTTTAMIAWMLSELGQDPSYIIGGISKNLNSNAHAGQGQVFVIEADEYDRMFLGLKPDWIVLTTLEHDHPDCFPTPEEYVQAFSDFIAQLRPGGGALICRDDAGVSALTGALPGGTHIFPYGLDEGQGYFATGLSSNAAGGMTFSAYYQAAGQPAVRLAEVQLSVPGEHNVRNALAALAVIHQLGLPVYEAGEALANFLGTGRRFDVLGEAAGVTVIDDYAHHPTEIRATLSAARQRYPDQRIWAVWQPHTYSRTQTLLDGFLHAFDQADRVLVTEVYAAREDNPTFSAAQVVAAMPHPAVTFAPTLDNAVRAVPCAGCSQAM